MLKRLQKQSETGSISHKKQKKIKNNTPGSEKPLGEAPKIDEDEIILEQVVLGGDDDINEKLQDKSSVFTKKSRKKKKCHEEPEAAWEDEDDSNIRVEISSKDFRHRSFKHKEKSQLSGEAYTSTLKSQFEKITGQPSWAKLKWQKSDSEGEESDDDPESRKLLQRTGNYLSTPGALQRGILEISRCTDANKEHPGKAKIRALEFHPSAQVVLTAGSHQTLALFQVDGKHNPKIQSLFLEDFPILSAHFTRDGSEVIMSSKYRYFKYYDMLGGQVIDVEKNKSIADHSLKSFQMSPDGKYIVFLGVFGNMHIYSSKGKEYLTTMKMNGSVEAVAFSSDGSKMFSHGDDGEVYVWDMKTRDCIHKFVDDGCIKGTSLAVSRNGEFIATGSYSGVVNIYDQTCLSNREPTPVKSVMNLTTPCTDTVFNSTSEVLAIASNYAENGIKMVHMSSHTVFSNWPASTDHLHIPFCMDFSLNSGYFTLGNNKGQALLYRLKHYSDY